MIQLILFDLDGTLLDSLDDIADAMNRVLTDLRLPTHGRDAYRYFVGEGADVLVERALPPGPQFHALRPAALTAFKAHYADCCFHRTAPYPGIEPLLEELTRRAVPFAVLSNKPHEATQRVIAHYFGRFAWAAVAGHRHEVPKKPHPDAALSVARQLGVEPRHCAFVGDTRTDMLTAVGAGMIPVGVRWGFRDDAELLDAGATVLLDTPAQLLDVIASHHRTLKSETQNPSIPR